VNTQASEFVGSIPEHYDRSLGPRIFSGFAKDLAARVASTASSSVLELAAGTGILTRHLRDLLPDSSALTATDLNAPMLNAAKVKFEDEEKVCFEVADATQLQHANESFDGVACQFGVMFFPDKVQSFKEAYRVLKPGGHYHFNVWDSWDNNPFARITHGVVEQFFPDDPPEFYKVPFGYHDTDQIAAALTEAGFSHVESESVELQSNIPSAKEFALGLVFGNPLLQEIVDRQGNPDDICAVVASELLVQLGREMPLQAQVFKAQKT